MLEDEDNSQYLTEREYFELESHCMQSEKIELERQILFLKRDCNRKDVAILKYQLAEKDVALGKLNESLVSLSVKVENVKKSKQRVTDSVTERLKLPDDWGYDPETLKIK